MPMKLDGSCQCGKVTFSVDSHTPVPYMICACSICRKIGTYGYACNLGAATDTLKIHTGEDVIKKYSAVKDRGTSKEENCSSKRSFCSNCATMLWNYDDRWPELIHPFASCIDTELPEAKEVVCIMEGSKPKWVRWPEGKKTVFDVYPDNSLEGWHKEHNVYVE